MIMNPKNDTILMVMLLVTAAVLSVLLVGSWSANKAYAGTSADHKGDYIMVTGAITDSSELLYIIDVPNKRMLAYYADPIQNTMRVVDDVNLSTTFR
jgi:hypothetical protein